MNPEKTMMEQQIVSSLPLILMGLVLLGMGVVVFFTVPAEAAKEKAAEAQDIQDQADRGAVYSLIWRKDAPLKVWVLEDTQNGRHHYLVVETKRGIAITPRLK